MVLRELICRIRNTDQLSYCRTCFGFDMYIRLPAAMDIYLAGAKSHDSELRLAKYMIHHLHADQIFVDVGAHFGYFTLLANLLVGQQGMVHAFEAAPDTFVVLRQNHNNKHSIQIHNHAVSDNNAEVEIYQFPTQYSEYNTLDVAQFETASWFVKNQPKVTKIKAVTLTDFFNQRGVHPHLIKIDVEGSEARVIQGAAAYLRDHAPAIVMEYLSAERGNEAHRAAHDMLLAFGYDVYRIDHQGYPSKINDISDYFKSYSLASDNLLYQK